MNEHDELRIQSENKNKPWMVILKAQESFINELECIAEMISLVLPVLKSKDQERNERIKQLTKDFKEEDGKQINIVQPEGIKEFLTNIKKFKHGEVMFRQSIVTTIVTKFDELIMKLLKISFEKNSGWLKNPDKKITYKELLEIESLDKIKEEIIEKEISGLMHDSHYSQIIFLDSQLKLGIEDQFPLWKEFLEITERRNVFVHTGGRVSSKYLDNCKKWGIKIGDKCKEGARLSAKDEYIKFSLDCFYELSVRLCQSIMRRLFPESYVDGDWYLNNRTVDLLSEERFQLAERILNFAIGIPDKMQSKSEYKYYFIINLCIAEKFQGKEITEIIKRVNWDPFHPKYHFAIAVLEKRFKEAAELMKQKIVYDEIGEENFKEWPLLRDFRQTDEFTTVFNEIFHKDFHKVLLEDVAKEIDKEKLEIKAELQKDVCQSEISDS